MADQQSKEAAVVDPSFNADQIIRVIKSNSLQLKYIINTHGHSDHTAGNAELKSIFGAKTVGYERSRISPDIKVKDGDILAVGKINFQVIYTPGHTLDSICLLVDKKKLLTGDTLFVGECGRTDLPGGNAKSMYDSLFNKLSRLGKNVEIYPGHDYGPKRSSTLGEEKKSNYTLKPRSVEDFLEFMSQP